MKLMNLQSLGLLCLLFLTACDSGQNNSPDATVQPQSVNSTDSSVAFTMPERIRTSRAVDLNATNATITTNAGDVNLTRNGDQFVGSIRVEPGTNFSFTVTISENIGGEEVVYATRSGVSNEPVNADLEIEIDIDDYRFPDDDGDGADNLSEIEAGSNHANSFSTPANPDGMPPTETTPGLVEFSASTFTVAEADGTLVIPVLRTGGSDGRVTVNYSLNSETALIGRDFDVASGVLVWADGETTPQSFTVTIRPDDLNDGEHTFTANLSVPTGGVAIGSGSTRVTIIDSTPAAQRGIVQITSSSLTVDEDAGQIIVEVERTGGSDGLVTVGYFTETGTASAEDFTQITAPRVLQWDDGEDGIRTIIIPITNDSEEEDAETFTLNLSNPLGGVALGLAQVPITITDTTPVVVTAAGSLSFASSAPTVAEGSSIDIEVERTGGSDGDATVDYVISAGTADDDDFIASSGELTWEDGDSGSQFITINTITDDLLETNETIVITLQNANGVDIADNRAVVTITDTTSPVPGVIVFSATTASVEEGDSIEIPVSRTGGSNGVVTVDVVTDASTELTVTPAVLTWADGDSDDQTITLTAIADDLIDDTETVSVSLTNATGGAIISSTSISVIINDTSEPAEPEPPGPAFFVATDGEWEACIAPFNTPGPSAFATQLSVNEGRIVSCIKTCDVDLILPDEEFTGWGWNPVDLHSCTTARNPGGAYTLAPIYTPERETVNLSIDEDDLIDSDSIWGCNVETRVNAETDYEATDITVWYQFLDDGTYLYGSSDDGLQPPDLLGPDIWSVDGRVLELGHINTGYRNTLFVGRGSQTLHIHRTAEDRLNCSLEARLE